MSASIRLGIVGGAGWLGGAIAGRLLELKDALPVETVEALLGSNGTIAATIEGFDEVAAKGLTTTFQESIALGNVERALGLRSVQHCDCLSQNCTPEAK